jgi:hypothetical protein
MPYPDGIEAFRDVFDVELSRRIHNAVIRSGHDQNVGDHFRVNVAENDVHAELVECLQALLAAWVRAEIESVSRAGWPKHVVEYWIAITELDGRSRKHGDRLWMETELDLIDNRSLLGNCEGRVPVRYQVDHSACRTQERSIQRTAYRGLGYSLISVCRVQRGDRD